MPEPIRCYFDPLCPWCYQTSRWVNRLQELGEVRVSWGLFSLEMANGDGTTLPDDATAAWALRTAVVVRDECGDAALGRFYAALGAAIHERGEPVDDAAVIGKALADAGVDPGIAESALADPATRSAVEQEHCALVERTRSFGVPTIALDDGEGPAIFGPVISDVPSDEDAVQLWRHVAWLTRYENFSELKRDRIAEPDLESVRRYRARRA
ncbi:MAG TPA: DsbA family protein [Egibacteraceae bacterium]|nr:DsbA family protein [Egibacteraceae bacterium]